MIGEISLEQKTRFEQTASAEQLTASDRSAVLDAIKNGCNTLRAIVDATRLSSNEVRDQLWALTGPELEKRQIGVVNAWFVKGAVPPGRLYLNAATGKVEAAAADSPAVTKVKKPPVWKSTRQSPSDSGSSGAIETPQPVRTPPVASEPIAPPKVADAAVEKSSPEQARADRFEQIPLRLLVAHPDNPRGGVDTTDQSFADLVNSIAAVGIQEPLIVTPVDDADRYRIVCGHRRAAAAARADHQVAPCVVRFFASEELEYSVMLIENLQRQDLLPSAEARAFNRLVKQGKTINDVARETGLTQSFVQSRLRLLRLEFTIQQLVDTGGISPKAGEHLSALPVEKQLALLPRARRLSAVKLAQVIKELADVPADRVNRRKSRTAKPILTETEAFTRSWAIESLQRDVRGRVFTGWDLIEAFDDVCLDHCVETRNETACQGCPVPRLVASIIRRKFDQRKELLQGGDAQ